MDREKIFDAFRNCITEPKCKDCQWEQCEQFNQKKVSIPLTLALDVLNLLKEQDGMMLALEQSNAANEYLNAEVERLTGLLKEQEAVEPGLMQDAKGVWNTCGKCGHILKSAILNPMDENDTFFYFPNFCSECGQAVKWNERR